MHRLTGDIYHFKSTYFSARTVEMAVLERITSLAADRRLTAVSLADAAAKAQTMSTKARRRENMMLIG